MGNEGEGAHEQEEDGGPVLRVAVELPGHTDQSQQPGRLQQANQSGGLGCEREHKFSERQLVKHRKSSLFYVLLPFAI